MVASRKMKILFSAAACVFASCAMPDFDQKNFVNGMIAVVWGTGWNIPADVEQDVPVDISPSSIILSSDTEWFCLDVSVANPQNIEFSAAIETAEGRYFGMANAVVRPAAADVRIRITIPSAADAISLRLRLFSTDETRTYDNYTLPLILVRNTGALANIRHSW